MQQWWHVVSLKRVRCIGAGRHDIKPEHTVRVLHGPTSQRAQLKEVSVGAGRMEQVWSMHVARRACSRRLCLTAFLLHTSTCTQF